MTYQNPISGYSKAPWGLSVLSQVTRIFTGITISPSPSLRQCPDRYAFRAGRNLPDKEFRYLRTVIVTPLFLEAPLLPKLRGHFAEFLNEGFLARLRFLTPPTCVGLRYGHLQTSLAAFLDSVGSVASVLYFPPIRISGLMPGGFAYLTPYLLRRTLPAVRSTYLPVSLLHSNGPTVVSEFQPIFHHLRLSASA